MPTEATKLAPAPELPTEVPEACATHEEIAALAYSLWQERRCREGSSEDDWFRAEQALMARRQT